jgi:hypothetical protein
MAITFGLIWKQLFPAKPSLTETNLPSLAGRHFMVTGATSGVGIDLTSILNSAVGTVYMFTRNSSKTLQAMSDIKSSQKTATPGALHHIHMDLVDLSTIQPAVEKFQKIIIRVGYFVQQRWDIQRPSFYQIDPGNQDAFGHQLCRSLSSDQVAPSRACGDRKDQISRQCTGDMDRQHVSRCDGPQRWSRDCSIAES